MISVTEVEAIITALIREGVAIKNKYPEAVDAPVNYVCIFSRDAAENDALLATAAEIGHIVKNTPTGPLFQIESMDTIAGKLQLLKIRKPDPTKNERGDADFTLTDYTAFKKKYLNQPGFKLISRPEMEMIELAEDGRDTLVYFSDPPLDRQLGIGV